MNIAIVDDHLILAQSLQKALQESMPMASIRVFDNGLSFLAQDLSSWKPEIVLTDILMPKITGLEMMQKALPLMGANTKFILMTSVSDANTVKTALQNGAKGYVSKTAPLQEIQEAIESVRLGRQYISSGLKDDLLNYIFTDQPMIATLSARENEVLQLVCAGRTPKEIAFDMKLSLHTIQLYNKNIMRKFNLNRMADVMMFAVQKGLYNPKEI